MIEYILYLSALLLPHLVYIVVWSNLELFEWMITNELEYTPRDGIVDKDANWNWFILYRVLTLSFSIRVFQCITLILLLWTGGFASTRVWFMLSGFLLCFGVMVTTISYTELIANSMNLLPYSNPLGACVRLALHGSYATLLGIILVMEDNLLFSVSSGWMVAYVTGSYLETMLP